MKRLKNIMLVMVLLLSACTREEPLAVTDLLLETMLPEHFKAGIYFAKQEVVLTSTSRTYRFTTDDSGRLLIPEIIPDIYTINTSWEISGKQYKEMIVEEIWIEDKSRVMIGTTLQNIPLYNSQPILMVLERFIMKDLLISKVYFSGTKDDLNRNYTIDGFVEIFNNSDEVVYVDGKYLALTESRSPAAFLATDDPDYLYTRQICRFPGNGTDYPVLPGKSIVVAARSARDHRTSASNSVDLSSAEFEVKDSDGTGNPAVKALPVISSSTALKHFNLISGGPNGVFLFETDEDVLQWPEFYTPGTSTGERFRQVPVTTVLDGVEILKNNASTGPDPLLKRLHQFIDAGYTNITAVSGYVNESVERKISRIEEDGRVILQDTNNSTVDFVIINGPQPRKYDHSQLLKSVK